MNSNNLLVNQVIKLCFWNINGVKNKFMSDEVKNLFRESDIVIIIETKFNIRCKCPDDFTLISRSKVDESWTRPRGGVAVFKKYGSNLELSILSEDFTDCVIFEIASTDMIIIAMYLPPSNSSYYDDRYFENIKLFLERFDKRSYCFVGDFNSRMGVVHYLKGHQYLANPDESLNQNGRKLRQILNDFPGLILINGLIYDNRNFESKYTFFRGDVSSQVDLCFTNNVKVMKKLEILDKLPHSDHCPCVVTFDPSYYCDLDTVNDCACNFMSYNHYDVNKRLDPSIKLERCNLLGLSNDLQRLGNDINAIYNDQLDKKSINEMCYKLTSGIRNACKRNKKTSNIEIHPIHANCSSENFKAIAHANFTEYKRLEVSGDASSNFYRNEWLKYHQIAIEKEEEEIIARSCKEWRHLQDNDPKKLWSKIDWKGNIKSEEKISPSVIDRFFKNVFQSPLTRNDPIISDAEREIIEYHNNAPENIDAEISRNEVELSVKKKRKGSSFDAIAPDTLAMAPPALIDAIHKLMKGVFNCTYPQSWKTQMLLPFPKKGHSEKDPKLRGVAIGPLMSRIFDTILDNRFQEWYQPNPEQAGFRKKQGCIVQIFSLFLLIDIAKKCKKDLYIGLIDYEKAFDFTNRFLLIKELIDKGIGSKFLTSLYNVYKQTSYITKVTNSSLGNEIETKFGVTQGKGSSANLFSFFISDLSESIVEADTDDFMDPFSVLQLADDTSIFAENIISFQKKMQKACEYSKKKSQKINKKKTKFICMSDKYVADIKITEDITISAINANEGYNWLGMWLTPTLDTRKLTEFNINKKMGNIAKFYAWLEVNTDTPINIKTRVLYSCLFASIIYACEAWGSVEPYAEKLKVVERKALKACLGVKQGTPNDIIYHELNQPDIIAVIRTRQCKFFQKYSELNEQDCISKEIWNLYNVTIDDKVDGNIQNYYRELTNNISEVNMLERKDRIHQSQSTMTKRYVDVTMLNYSKVLYKSFNIERNRITLTRWRMSSHKLFIETGRYTVPKTPREERLCMICLEIEDEMHALFNCRVHRFIRMKYGELLLKYPTVIRILNPLSTDDANLIAKYIREIESNMLCLKMVRS